MGRWLTTLTTTALLLLALPTQGATPRASIHLKPYGYVTSPGATNISIHIERNPANRAASFEFISETYYTESQWPLNGESAQASYRFQRTRLPAGNYIAFITVYWQEGATLQSWTAKSELLTVVE